MCSVAKIIVAFNLICDIWKVVRDVLLGPGKFFYLFTWRICWHFAELWNVLPRCL